MRMEWLIGNGRRLRNVFKIHITILLCLVVYSMPAQAENGYIDPENTLSKFIIHNASQPDQTYCKRCHPATYLPDVGYSRMGTNAADSCWLCHVGDPKEMTATIPTSFHETRLVAPTWRCTNCHPT